MTNHNMHVTPDLSNSKLLFFFFERDNLNDIPAMLGKNDTPTLFFLKQKCKFHGVKNIANYKPYFFLTFFLSMRQCGTLFLSFKLLVRAI